MITPTMGIAIKFDIKKKVENLLKLIQIIGDINICAEIGTDNIFASFLFIFFDNKLVICLCSKTIPSVPKKESCSPTSFIANGLFMRIINSAIIIELITSGFLYRSLEESIIIAIMLALTTETLKFVILIKKQIKIIINTVEIF